MEKIRLLEIAKEFNEKISEDFRKNGESKENYRGSRTFTGTFYKLMKDVLSSKENQMIDYENEKEYQPNQLYFQKERLTVDLTVWISGKDSVVGLDESSKVNTDSLGHVWRYVMLIEHENSGKSWLHEMQKLCTINSQYKLIITYGRTETATDNIKATKNNKGVHLLKYAEKILEYTGVDSFEEFIIMFGEENKNIVNSKNDKVYDIYHCSKGNHKFVKVD